MLLGMLLVTLHEDVVGYCYKLSKFPVGTFIFKSMLCLGSMGVNSPCEYSCESLWCTAFAFFFVIVRQFIFPKYVSVSDLVECISLLNDQHCLICRTIRNVY